MIAKFGAAVAILALSWLVPIQTANAADPLPAETRLVASTTAPAINPANPTTFLVAGPQDLTVTLTDLKIPAEMSSASVAVTQAGALVGSATLTNPATSATFAIPAANGMYSIYVVGAPGNGVSRGTFTLCVAPTASPSNCIQADSFPGSVTAQGTAADPTTSTLSVDIVVAAAGAYTFTATDFAFPAGLNSAPSMALFQGATVVQAPVASGSAVSLGVGTYTLRAIAQADPTARAGLYGLRVTGPSPSTSALLDSTIPVGLLPAGAPFTNPSAQSVKLTVTDYAFPAALQSAAALLTVGGQSLATATSAGGPVTVAAPQGPLELWTYAAAGTSAGTYGAVVSAAADLYTAAHGVAGPAGTSAYAFVVSPELTAGTAYQITAADLQFPAQLNGITLAVAQGVTVTKQPSAGAPIAFTPGAAGAVVLLASATAPSTSGSCTPTPSCSAGYGLFDVSVATAASTPQLVFDRTQTVSTGPSLFDSQTLNIGAASANFDVAVIDLKFPASFANLALVVSQGGTVLGKIYGGGTFTFPGTAGGAYQLTFAATPDAAEQFGLYGVSTVFSPPTVTLSASASSAPAGSLVTLSWTTTNAASCMASGGNFSGSITPGTGSQAVRLDATTTYQLQCAGPGGSLTQMVSVTATAAAASSHGGGGMGGYSSPASRSSAWVPLFARALRREARGR